MEILAKNGYPRYSDGELHRRHEALRAVMEEQSLAAVVVGGLTTQLENSVQYFTNWPPLDDSYAVFGPTAEPVVIARPWNHVPDATRIGVVEDVRYGGINPEAQAATVAGILRERCPKGGRVGLIGSIRYSQIQIMDALVAGVGWWDATSWYRHLRLIKSEEELAYIRVAAGMADKAIEAMAHQLHVGMREYEIVRVIEDAYIGERGSTLIHFTLSTPMGHPELCVPHQHQPDRILERGDVVATEISATFWGYSGQILRSFTIGSAPTAQYQELYDVGSAVYADIVNTLRAGVTVREILDCGDQISRAGLDIWDALLHGWGGPGVLPPIVRTRKSGGATEADDYAFEEGSVVVIQPNIISADHAAGVQLGNAVYIKRDGVEVLQQYPMQFVRCG